MKLEFHRVETLPKMAWCATIRKHDPTVRILHGSYVEVADGFFCDGAWSGEFGRGEFETNLLMGSAGKVVGGRLLISTPDHTMERICVLKNDNVMLISNSCAFVFAQANDEPDPNHIFYPVELSSILQGINKYARSIPTRNGSRIHLFYHCNIHVGADLELVETPKAPVRDFTDFTDYRAFLEEKTGAIVRNANDAKRRVHYRPIATISSGYDSPASAVFARKAGCDEAITFRRSRPRDGSDADDSGEAIAQVLGMRVRVFDRLDYLKMKGFPEAEGGITEFLILADHLERRVLFTGFNDAVWSRSSKTASRFIHRTGLSGNSLAELRLRVGFVHLAVPYLGCTSLPSIHRISTSKEMEPWSIGGGHDKPIPRRLVEEAGVKREMFGMGKKAVAIVPQLEGYEKTMTPESLADFSRFYAETATFPVRAKLRLCTMAHQAALIQRELNWRIAGLASRLSGRRVPAWPVLIPSGVEMTGERGRYAFFFHWSMRKLRARYEVDTVGGAPGTERAAVAIDQRVIDYRTRRSLAVPASAPASMR